MKPLQLFFGLLFTLSATGGIRASGQYDTIVANPTGSPARVITLRECLKLSLANSPAEDGRLDQVRLKYSYKAASGAGLPR